ncbi:MAG: M20/M25/M40 family metallo-hydrolase [Bdellovibrionota bacterium]|nr:MAG: M20/M25/M40 family metallo-hydrolase [Bdellovibrionota bacterium]
MDKVTLALTKRLIRVRSDPGAISSLRHALHIAVSSLTGFTVERFERNSSPSALIYASSRRPRRFRIILNGHLDVIPGKPAQYTPVILRNRLYGVGAMDMKANVAVLIKVFREVARQVNYPLGLQLVTDEETGGFDGTAYQISRGVQADFIIAGESTGFHIAHRAKGVLWLRITCKGRTAHGAYPWRGENAVSKMLRFVRRLEEQFPNPSRNSQQTTINVSRIETSNTSLNKVPDDCSVFLDLRFVQESSAVVLKKVRDLLPAGFCIEVLAHEQALDTPRGSPYVRELRRVTQRLRKRTCRLYTAQGTSDARHYMLAKGAGVEFGPIGGGIGTDNEWVSIPSLLQYEKILRTFLLMRW